MFANDVYWLIHHDWTGEPFTSERIAGVMLAAAVLADLLKGGAAGIIAVRSSLPCRHRSRWIPWTRTLSAHPDLFFYGTVAGGLGVLIMVGAIAIAVIRFFHHHPYAENLWRRRIAPTVSAVFLLTILALTVVGVAVAWYLRTRRPEVHAVIGHGDRATRNRPTPELISSPRSGDRDRDLANRPRHSYLNR